MWLLVALAISGQAMAGYAQRLPCFDQGAGGAPAVAMDCHSAHGGHTGQAPGQPDCCGDSCPDMTACAAPHAISPSDVSRLAPEQRSLPVDRYAVASITALSAPPFRPPALSHA